jgi:ligand-binding sensor domain-containing protein
VAAQKNIVMTANLRRIAVSVDKGKSWESMAMPEPLTQISAIAVDEMGNLWVGGREGLLVSVDHGATWKTLHNLYVTQVTGLYFDGAGHRVLVTASSNTVAFSAHLPDFKVNVWDSGWDLRFVRPVGDHMVGATMYDGIVVQPVMVDTPLVGAN